MANESPSRCYRNTLDSCTSLSQSELVCCRSKCTIMFGDQEMSKESLIRRRKGVLGSRISLSQQRLPCSGQNARSHSKYPQWLLRADVEARKWCNCTSPRGCSIRCRSASTQLPTHRMELTHHSDRQSSEYNSMTEQRVIKIKSSGGTMTDRSTYG